MSSNPVANSPDQHAAVHRPSKVDALISVGLPLAIMAVALALRVYNFDRLSLWLDEIYVVDYISLPWRELAGLEGAYDNHPPLYFLVVKLVAQYVDPLMAARYLSIATGTLTVGAVYLLTRNLVNRQAAAAAAIVLTISPVHIWYSQEGRMYAPAALAVTLSYLALIRLLQRPTLILGAIYSGTVIVSVYTDYSSFYGLIPQVVVVAYASWKSSGKLFRRWLVSVGVAFSAFLPWLRSVAESIDFVGGDREFLIVTESGIVDSFFSMLGLPSGDNYYWGIVDTPWARWPEVRPLTAALASLLLIFSVVALTGKYRLSLVTGASLLVGTISAAAFLSYVISPGFADRTVIFAAIGWAILAGSAAFGRLPNGGGRLALSGLTLLIACSALSTSAMYQQATKEEYRELAAVAQYGANLGIPVFSSQRPADQVLADSTGLISTALSSYEDDLDTSSIPTLPGVEMFWYAYAYYDWESESVDSVRIRLDELGYEQVLSEFFSPILYLDLYMSRSHGLGTTLSLPDGNGDTGGEHVWTVDTVSAEVNREVAISDNVTIFDTAPTAEPVVIEQPAQPHQLYVLSTNYRFDLPVGYASSTLTCLGPERTILKSNVEELTAAETQESEPPYSRVGILCPAQTEELRLTYANHGVGSLHINVPRLIDVGSGPSLTAGGKSWSNLGRPGLLPEA